MIAITSISKKLVEQINACHFRIEHMGEALLEEALSAGHLLSKAKAELPHGAWMGWVENNLTFTHRTATNYMRLNDLEEAGKLETVSNISAAYQLIKSPPKIAASPAPAAAEQEVEIIPPAPPSGRVKDAVVIDAELVETEPPLLIAAESKEAPQYDEAAIRLATEHGVTPADVVRAGQFAEVVEALGLKAAVWSGKSFYDIILMMLPHLTKAEMKTLIEKLNSRWA